MTEKRKRRAANPAPENMSATEPTLAQAELCARRRKIQTEIAKLRAWCEREGVPWQPTRS